MAIEIRDVAREDAAAIAAIYNLGIAERSATFETEPRSEAQIGARIEQHDRFPMLVAVDTDVVVGWAGLSEYRPRACYAGIGEFSIYLAREARGRGTGRTLLLALIDRASSPLTRQAGRSVVPVGSARSEPTRSTPVSTVSGSTSSSSSA
jgi:L-amino acid N-acyltransferase YncA